MGNIFHKLGDYLEEDKKNARIRKENAKKLPLDTRLNIKRFIDEKYEKKLYLYILWVPFFELIGTLFVFIIIRFAFGVLPSQLILLGYNVTFLFFRLYPLWIILWFLYIIVQEIKNRKFMQFIDRIIKDEIERTKHGKR